MSKEKPNEDPRQHTDWKNTKQTDQPWRERTKERRQDRLGKVARYQHALTGR